MVECRGLQVPSPLADVQERVAPTAICRGIEASALNGYESPHYGHTLTVFNGPRYRPGSDPFQLNDHVAGLRRNNIEGPGVIVEIRHYHRNVITAYVKPS